MCVILAQLYPKATSLNPNRGVALWIKARGTTQNFGRNLVFLERDSRVIERVFREITKKFTERFGAVEAMAFGKSLYLLGSIAPDRATNVCVTAI